MIVAMPTGVAHGWGIAGQHLIEELYRLPPVPGVTLHSMNNPDFAPSFPNMWNKKNVGYCFFENDIEAYRHMREAKEKWDFIIAGSSWCEHHLRIGGVERTATILQGIDPDYFYAGPSRIDDGRFLVFSGGKFELRKSQDVVIAAMKVFMDRHRDAWLSCAWHNQWPFSVATMAGSRCIQFAMDEGSCEEIIRATLARNGLDASRVILHPMTPNTEMRRVYLESDIGLFPNRCEGGNNMVMCEYMACGRTVIASNKTGHADVITPENAFALQNYTIKTIERNDMPSALWFEPSVDEVIEQLEYAYQHRDEVSIRAAGAAESMRRLDWREAAQRFHQIAQEVAPPGLSTSAHEFLLRGIRLTEIGRADMAESQVRQALACNPLDGNSYLAMGTILTALGREGEAQLYRHKGEQLTQERRQ